MLRVRTGSRFRFRPSLRAARAILYFGFALGTRKPACVPCATTRNRRSDRKGRARREGVCVKAWSRLRANRLFFGPAVTRRILPGSLRSSRRAPLCRFTSLSPSPSPPIIALTDHTRHDLPIGKGVHPGKKLPHHQTRRRSCDGKNERSIQAYALSSPRPLEPNPEKPCIPLSACVSTSSKRFRLHHRNS